MSREIKFRIWDGKEMSEPYDEPGDIQVTAINKYFEEAEENNEHVMQFTGLKDKNGVEIYEGDILRHYDDLEFINDIEWDDAGGGWAGPGCYSEWGQCEVIGNIYENKDLLEI